MMPANVISVREELCEVCAVYAVDPCAICEHGKWGVYDPEGCTGFGKSEPIFKKEIMPLLGDRFANIAQPIARTIDRIAGTSVATCGGCKKMRADLNSGMTFWQTLKERLRK